LKNKNLRGLDLLPRPTDKLIRLLENFRDHYLTGTLNLPGGCVFVNLAVELGEESPHLGMVVHEDFIRRGR
jgi:TetR/AcrR family transcriptional regulator, transcriptional repressor for nem operon